MSEQPPPTPPHQLYLEGNCGPRINSISSAPIIVTSKCSSISLAPPTSGVPPLSCLSLPHSLIPKILSGLSWSHLTVGPFAGQPLPTSCWEHAQIYPGHRIYHVPCSRPSPHTTTSTASLDPFRSKRLFPLLHKPRLLPHSLAHMPVCLRMYVHMCASLRFPVSSSVHTALCVCYA